MAEDTENGNSIDQIHEKLFTITDEKILQILSLIARADIDARRIATDPLRPRLVKMRPNRPLIAMRIFAEPFEDLLDHADRYDRTAKRISRGTISMAWKFLMDTSVKQASADIEKYMRDVSGEEDAGPKLVAFWKLCGEELDSAVSRNPQTLKALATMARRDVYRQLGDMGQLLRHSDLQWRIKAELPPKPIGDLIDEDVAVLVEVLQESVRRGADVIELTLRVLMSRMARPGDLLEILTKNDIGIPAQEQAILTREMGAQASAHAVQQADHAAAMKEPTPIELIDEVSEVAERIASLQMDGLKGITVIDEQLNNARNTLRDTVISQIVNGAEPEISGALLDAASMGKSPEQREERLQQAEDHLIALRRAERYGTTLRIGDVLDKTLKDVSGQIEAQAERAIEDMIDTPKGQRDVEQAKEVLYTSVRMLELSAGSARADALRKRGLTSLNDLTSPDQAKPSATDGIDEIDGYI